MDCNVLTMFQADFFSKPNVGSEEQRLELINRLQELKSSKAQDINITYSNPGCWRYNNPVTDCYWLNEELYKLTLEVIEFYQQTQFSNIAEYVNGQSNIEFISWANINDKYSRNVYHSHKTNHFSACYYLQGTDTGDLILTNPANILNDCNNFSPYARDFTFKPKDGDLVLWPAWVPHEVEMNLSDRQRINIAFNINIVN